MQRIHNMPFGATLLENGVGLFRLWAPSAKSVLLSLEHDEKIAMSPLPAGWWEAHVDRAHYGMLYRYTIDDNLVVPDPASRFQPYDVMGPSELIDPRAYRWHDSEWRGRPWEEVVFYELHVGAFSPNGHYSGIEAKLDYLVKLGVTAIELMPIGDFPGQRNWGYDGVLHYAPDSSYGRPEDLKRLIDAAHARGLMVFLDVVYNHFGPSGNHLHNFAQQFFTERHHTPWGAAIAFDGEAAGPVRSYFINNALYWILEYNFDGLRFDAVDEIYDESELHILNAVSSEIRAAVGPDRHVHLTLENYHNQAHYLERGENDFFNAQWNDDIHHAYHVLLTGEKRTYYSDYTDQPLAHLARALTEGFVYQGEIPPSRKNPRGESSKHLPLTAFVSFLQNHDQIGNRAFGERLTLLTDPHKLALATLVLLLSPSIPLIFMGEEFGTEQPFLFFADFDEALAKQVREGRRNGFREFPEFKDEAARNSIPDPQEADSLSKSRLNWLSIAEPKYATILRRNSELLVLRRAKIVPLLKTEWQGNEARLLDQRGLSVSWEFNGGRLSLIANFSDQPLVDVTVPEGEIIAATSGSMMTTGQVELGSWQGGFWLSTNSGMDI